MNCLIFVGSPNKKAAPMQTAEALESRLKQQGFETEIVWINDLGITYNFCTKDTKKCLREYAGFCPYVYDDMTTLGDKIVAADQFVFVSPIYSCFIPDVIQSFLTRIIRGFCTFYGAERSEEFWGSKKVSFAAVCSFSPTKAAEAKFQKLMNDHCRQYNIFPDAILTLSRSLFSRFLNEKNLKKLDVFVSEISSKSAA
ncbi:hypothetical protein SDC9_70464 [bioreactor metagenome]|uniref:NADPH-dependent FMN reductase-like domain-containing protein n=1 Tax=bioreactor metagenome TaxID=1076179 RepID=A0A644Y731_9ZZZZ